MADRWNDTSWNWLSFHEILSIENSRIWPWTLLGRNEVSTIHVSIDENEVYIELHKTATLLDFFALCHVELSDMSGACQSSHVMERYGLV